jgi:predicted ATPase
LLNLIHVPGLRGNPERSYAVSRVGTQFPGAFHDYTASVLSHWKEKKSKDKLKQVGEDLQSLGLTWKVDAFKIHDTRVELKVGRLPSSQQGGAQDMVNITDVGFGVSQVMPVIVALNVAEEGQLVHIEQPEIHLHPNAQVQMAKILLRAARRGVRLIVETHSSTLLKAIQVEIATSEGLESLVQLHWCSRDDEGVTHVHSVTPDALGAYGDWPVDFNEVELALDSSYIEAIYKKHHEKK